MTAPHTSRRTSAFDRLGLNRWLQLFLTIIAGAAVAVIAWAVIQRFLHIIALLVASFLVAYILDPMVERLQRGGVRRALAILVVYLALFAVIGVGLVLLLGPLTAQLQAVIGHLSSLVSAKAGPQTQLDRFFHEHGLRLTVAGLRSQLASYISSAGAQLLNSTLQIVTGIVAVVTDLLLVLAITFYLLLDGHNMHDRAVRLLPELYRDRWFFFEATVHKVLGGYIRGQLIVAATVGIFAGAGCWALGVRDYLVIGLLAFLFEFIPMLGPVLGMVPAVIIALFQPMPLVIWVVIYFIVLQQVEANLIVPRVSGHAVGLHPLAALLALLAGVELGGLGGALLAVPLAGVLWVLVMDVYRAAGGASEQPPAPAVTARRASAITLARQVFERRRPRAVTPLPASDRLSGPAPVGNERLATIKQEQEHLIEQFRATEAQQATGTGEPGPEAGRAPSPHDQAAPDAV